MSQDAIRVVCRLRPLNKIEIANKGEECVEYTAKDININVGLKWVRLKEQSMHSLSIAFLDPVQHKSKFTKMLQHPSLKQSLEASTALFLHMARQEEERLGPCR